MYKYINRMKRNHSQALCSLAISLWDCSLQCNTYAYQPAEHLPGKEDTTADQESKTMRQMQLNVKLRTFNQIQSQAKLIYFHA